MCTDLFPFSLSKRSMLASLLMLCWCAPAMGANLALFSAPEKLPVPTPLHQGTDPDSLTKVTGKTLVVTATRSEKALEDVAAPVSIITGQEIRSSGLIRLDDALLTLPGLTLFEDHGSGIQLRGFSPDYTLILLDGEPLIGRNAGTLDLSRISMKGVERIEVVEGPTSSLYGSEALAGVVNIISSRPGEGWSAGVESRVGTHGTVELSAESSIGDYDKGLRLLVNQHSSDGYDLSPDVFGTSAPSFTDRTLDARGFFRIGSAGTFRLGMRLNAQEQIGSFAIRPGSFFEQRYDDSGRRNEWSLNPSLEFRLTQKMKSRATLYHSGYSADVLHENISDGSTLYEDSFGQSYSKLEQQVNVLWNTHHLSIAGFGGIRESLRGDRYEDQDSAEQIDPSDSNTGATQSSPNRPEASQFFAFLQHEWIPDERWQVTLSGRYDAHSDYAARWTPKLSLLHKATHKLTVRASVGSGFKAPAFRQLYLSFSNSNAGYSVFGSTRLQEGLNRLIEQGVIETLFLDPSQLAPIRAEHSIAYNVGASWQATQNLRLKADVFHNDVSDLIETQPIAMKTNGQYVFTYFNLSEVYTRGLQTSAEYDRPIAENGLLGLSFGWQFIQSRDQDILKDINKDVVYGRDVNGTDYLIRRGHYQALFGRSPHMATVSARLEDGSRDLSLMLTGRWRSSYGYRDLDGNGIANRPDEKIPAHAILDLTLNHIRSLGNGSELTLQAGIRNLSGTQFPERVPSLSGRGFQVSLRFDLKGSNEP